MEAPLGDLPRALEVQRFAAARELEVGPMCIPPASAHALTAAESLRAPQINALCDTLKASGNWGAAALPRHLRRCKRRAMLV